MKTIMNNWSIRNYLNDEKGLPKQGSWTPSHRRLWLHHHHLLLLLVLSRHPLNRFQIRTSFSVACDCCSSKTAGADGRHHRYCSRHAPCRACCTFGRRRTSCPRGSPLCCRTRPFVPVGLLKHGTHATRRKHRTRFFAKIVVVAVPLLLLPGL